ncbi:PAS domain S-box protein [Lichenifustis flavocetrariae]|uniref:histidine kinase n=1 Tax=Lichenifustis flavocetrariae TaxID=2949735 RepID=A0AA42CNR1_9HYPH|nr:PAS domain S-box protein [Lichenifustis flavocetrariae]MCW6513066.1 PAS domain S-box protein [Lichenifustis flavocetrariae]
MFGLKNIITKSNCSGPAIFDAIPGLIAYWNSSLRCEFANKQYLDWFGKYPHEIIGMSLYDVIGEDLFHLNKPYIQGALRGETQHFERTITKIDGQVRQTMASYIPDIVDGNVAGFVVQVTDVTVLKETEAALRTEITKRERKNELLRKSRVALHKAQSLGQIGSWEWDAVEDIVVWSDELYRILGCDPAGVPPSFADHPKLYVPESWSLLQQAVERALNTGEPYVLELQFIQLDGERGWLEGRGEAITDENGKIIALHGTALDITRRKTVELELWKTRQFLERSGAVAGVGGWELDLLTKEITWSDQTCRLHDVEPGHRPTLGEAIGYYTAPSRPIIEKAVQDCTESGLSWDLELEVRSATGRTFWANTTGVAVFEGGKAVRLIGAFQDVSIVREAKRQLTEKSINLEATLDNIQQGLIKIGPDRTIQLVNHRAAELLDIPLEFLDGPRLQFDDVLAYIDHHGEFVQGVPGLGEGEQDKGQLLTVGTLEIVRSNGKVIEVVTSPVADGSVVVTYTDITARRRAETAVQSSEVRYRMLAESTSDIITQLDLHLVRRYVSPASRAMLGYDPEDMIGSHVDDFVHPDDAGAVHTMMEMLGAGAVPGDTATMTMRMRHKADHWIWLEASVSLDRDPDTGTPRSLISALRDVTERQRTARHLDKAKTIAEHAARLKAEFVANMSHELRTPLTGILGIHDILRNDPSLGQRQKHYIELARDSGRSLLTIVNDVLDFSKIEAGQLSIEKIPFDVDKEIEACCQLGREEANKKSLQIGLELETSAVSLIGDPGRLRQVVLNLLTNGLKFTEKGRVDVRARYCSEHACLRVEVSDTGIVITQAIWRLVRR